MAAGVRARRPPVPALHARQGGPGLDGRRRMRQDPYGLRPVRHVLRGEGRGQAPRRLVAGDAPPAGERRRQARPRARADRALGPPGRGRAGLSAPRRRGGAPALPGNLTSLRDAVGRLHHRPRALEVGRGARRRPDGCCRHRPGGSPRPSSALQGRILSREARPHARRSSRTELRTDARVAQEQMRFLLKWY